VCAQVDRLRPAIACAQPPEIWSSTSMMPVMAYDLLQSEEAFGKRQSQTSPNACLRSRMRPRADWPLWLEHSLAMATLLAPVIAMTKQPHR